MYRIVNGMLLKGKRANEWQLQVRHLGNGHAEASIRQSVHWEEVDAWAQLSPEELAKAEALREAEAEDRRQKNLERAARRAKTRVRHMIKAAGLDALLTLTYKANQTDQELCKRHMKLFVKRMRRLIPGFVYVAAFEPQERGAWHVHLAIHRLPVELPASNGVKVKSYNIVRAVWRSVTGEYGGNIDQQAKKRWSKQTTGKLAAYVSKYMLKAFEQGDDWSNRYSGSRIEVPDCERYVFPAESLAQLIDLAYSVVAKGDCLCMTYLSPFGDTFFLSTERPPPGARSH
jgi:hypothetical protein